MPNRRQPLFGQSRNQSRYFSGAALGLVAGLCFTTLPADNAKAQSLGELYSGSFQDRIANPSDASVLGQFMRYAVRAGQYDQAISTVEQYLIAHPRDPVARLIAAKLYHHIGSFELSRRQLDYALEDPALPSDKRVEAEELSAIVDRALNGVTSELALTLGAAYVHFSDEPGVSTDSSNDFQPFAKVRGFVRYDLKTATDDALIIGANASISRRFSDFDGFGDDFNFLNGGFRVTYDKGLPSEAIETLRLHTSVFGNFSSLYDDVDVGNVGISARFLARPSVSTLVYGGGRYLYWGLSDDIQREHEFGLSGGFTHRIAAGHAIGADLSASWARDDDGNDAGNGIVGDISYIGNLYSESDGIIWNHRLGIRAGKSSTTDAALAATDLESRFARIYWEHIIDFDDQNRLKAHVSFGQREFENTARESEDVTFRLSYTYRFR